MWPRAGCKRRRRWRAAGNGRHASLAVGVAIFTSVGHKRERALAVGGHWRVAAARRALLCNRCDEARRPSLSSGRRRRRFVIQGARGDGARRCPPTTTATHVATPLAAGGSNFVFARARAASLVNLTCARRRRSNSSQLAARIDRHARSPLSFGFLIGGQRRPARPRANFTARANRRASRLAHRRRRRRRRRHKRNDGGARASRLVGGSNANSARINTQRRLRAYSRCQK